MKDLLGYEVNESRYITVMNSHKDYSKRLHEEAKTTDNWLSKAERRIEWKNGIR